jgi:hypothetical protein
VLCAWLGCGVAEADEAEDDPLGDDELADDELAADELDDEELDDDELADDELADDELEDDELADGELDALDGRGGLSSTRLASELDIAVSWSSLAPLFTMTSCSGAFLPTA